MSGKYTGYVVSQTHWDREWYLTFQQFRVRLLTLMDELLELLDSSPEYKSFTTDGQTIMVVDYLEIRPEKEERIKRLVAEGRLHIGPWYVLPDEFLVSGEALVRNLMIGHRQANRWGHPMKVGYIPDPFGHISTLPAILQGFDIDSVLFGRGMGDEGAILPGEFIWEAPGGEQVLAIHLTTGYGNLAAIGYKNYDRNWGAVQEIDYANALERTQEVFTKMKAKTTTPALLFNNGSDHLLPQPELPEILRYLNKNIPVLELIHSDYASFLQAVRDHKPDLQVYKGEMRGARFNNLLPGVLSARMYIKQANQRCQQKLEKYAEPISAWSAVFSERNPEHELLWHAWELLIQNHPHDSICGCSIDQVHREMMPRFDQSEQIADAVVDFGLRALCQKIDTRGAEAGYALIVFNPHNWEVAATATCSIQVPEKVPASVVVDQEGNLVSAQQRGEWVVREQGRPLEYLHTIIFDAVVPAGGYRTYWLVPGKEVLSTSDLVYEKGTLENRFLKVEFHVDGTLSVLHKPSGKAYSQLLTLESQEDVGDEYDYAKAAAGEAVRGLHDVEIQVVDEGPQRTTIAIKGLMSLPIGIAEDRRKRSDTLVDCPVIHYVTLTSQSDVLEVKTEFLNSASDQRLRVCFPLPERVEHVHVEGHFDVLKRSACPPEGKEWFQPPVGYNAQQTWASAGNLTMINKGLPEYEVVSREQGQELTLTLLRSVGWLSRNDMVSRPDDHAGPGLATPEAQCLGRHEFEYALKFHSGDWEQDQVWKSAHEFSAPVKVVYTKTRQGSLESSGTFLHLSNGALIITALRPSAEDNAVIVRVFNPTTVTCEASFVSSKQIKKVIETNLNEEELVEINSQENLTWAPKLLRTFKVFF